MHKVYSWLNSSSLIYLPHLTQRASTWSEDTANLWRRPHVSQIFRAIFMITSMATCGLKILSVFLQSSLPDIRAGRRWKTGFQSSRVYVHLLQQISNVSSGSSLSCIFKHYSSSDHDCWVMVEGSNGLSGRSSYLCVCRRWLPVKSSSEILGNRFTRLNTISHMTKCD